MIVLYACIIINTTFIKGNKLIGKPRETNIFFQSQIIQFLGGSKTDRAFPMIGCNNCINREIIFKQI